VVLSAMTGSCATSFEPITSAAKQRWWTVQGWRTGHRTGTPLRVSPHGPPKTVAVRAQACFRKQKAADHE